VRVDADVAVVGSGFAGSLTALALTRRGKRVVLIERGKHPRFVIGESSTPLANLLLEELADTYDLPQIRVFSKWGTWQRARPDVAGGLKRGFTFYFHRPGEAFRDDDAHARQLMVAASPNDDIGDTHWYRPDFDLNLVREAQDAGVVYLDETAVDHASVSGGGVSIDAVRNGTSVRIEAGFLVDASGPRGFLARQFSLEAPPRWLPHTEGIYTHFENVARFAPSASGLPHAPPYPPDVAALHHVFPGGWIWVLRFNNGITSAGAALTRPAPSSWDELLATLPSVRDQFAGARAVAPWHRSPQLAFRTTRVGGRNWAMLPSAVRA